MRLFSPLFFGVFLLASGAIILLSHLLRYQIAVGRLIFGVFILLVGISMLTTNLGFSNLNFGSDKTVAFSSGDSVEAKRDTDYFVLFGSANYDLTGLEPGDRVKINCAFGSGKVILPEGEVRVVANGAFGTINHPEGSNSLGYKKFGSDSDNAIVVEIMCAFGSVSVVRAE